jgi:DNA-binding NarL/FixJ family response regulator
MIARSLPSALAGSPRGHRPDRPLRLLVADDHPAILDAIAQFVAGEDDIELVGLAGDGEQALRLIAERRPDVAILDIRMPRLNGVEVLKQLAGVETAPAVILFTGHPERTLLLESLDAGALGFLAKESPLADLVRAVRAVADGWCYIDPMLGGVLVGPQAEDRLVALNRREREILHLLADGLDNEQIGSALLIPPLSVQTHVKHIMEKLDSDARAKMVPDGSRWSAMNE